MLRTLGSRLTALATGITLVVSLILCVTLYLGIRFSLYGEVDAFLAGEVMEFHAILSEAGDDLEDVQRRIRAELGSRQGRDLAFRLLDSNGRVMLTSDPSNGLPDPWPVPAQPNDGMLFRTESGSALAARTRTGSRWVIANGNTRIVQATYLLDQANASLTRYLQICAAALAAAAILALVGGRVLAVRALRPVASMVSSARRISVESLRLRLHRTKNGDELDVLAATFNDMFERLERQVSQIRQFTADAAHELRTPLAALRGNAEVALSGKRSAEELRSVIADSIDEYDRLTRIANDLLLLARADAGQEFIRRTRLRLDTAVGDVVDLFAPLAEAREISLRYSVGREVWIEGDDGRLRQMVSNLVDNAIKHTPAGGNVELDLLATKSGTVELTVRDTGIGVSPEHLPHIFDRFYRAERARMREGGAGLGLAISRTIVEGHGGTIRLDSTLGMGTVVTVKLPDAPAPPR